MKIQIHCSSAGEEFWKVSITVMDGEDFPTPQIFQNDRDYPESPGYALVPGATGTINNIFSNAALAERWAERQVNCLQDHLKQWRKPSDSKARILYI